MDPVARNDARIWSDVIHLMPAWTWETDADYRLSYVNIRHSGLRMTAAELLGLNILHRPPPSVELSGLDDLIASLEAHEEIRSHTYERLLINGQRAVLMDSAVPLWGPSGTFRGYHGITLNISDVLRKADVTESVVAGLNRRAATLERFLLDKAEELERTNHLMTEVLDSMGEGLMVTSGRGIADPDNRIQMVNPAYLRLFGLKKEEVPVGMLLRDLVALLERTGRGPVGKTSVAEVSRAFQEGRKVVIETPVTGRSLSTEALKRPSGGYVVVHTDITDLRAQNAALREARDAADVANKAKSTFLANMSHEIRTPMNGIVGMADLLTETALSNEQADMVATIRGAALALTSLITDILDFSKIEAGRMQIDDEPFCLSALLDELRDLLSPLAGEKHLGLSCRIAEDVPRLVEGDALRIRQVLMNLIGNAIKFTHDGGVVLRLARSPGRGNELRFTVSDSGIGIPPDRLPGIFTPFEQVHSGRERQYEGTGLGLSITKKLVEVMGGEISAESEVGQGTTITVDLPLPAVAQHDPVAVRVSAEDLRLDGVRVLLVEDNRTNQVVAKKMLERRGAEVALAGHGRCAVDLYDPERFDIVLMDISMPVMNGLEAARILRAREADRGWPRRPIIALTGNAFDRDRAEAEASGMDGFLTKPVRRDALLLTIAAHLDPTAPPRAALG